jgi:hypothetical protein
MAGVSAIYLAAAERQADGLIGWALGRASNLISLRLLVLTGAGGFVSFVA